MSVKERCPYYRPVPPSSAFPFVSTLRAPSPCSQTKTNQTKTKSDCPRDQALHVNLTEVFVLATRPGTSPFVCVVCVTHRRHRSLGPEPSLNLRGKFGFPRLDFIDKMGSLHEDTSSPDLVAGSSLLVCAQRPFLSRYAHSAATKGK